MKNLRMSGKRSSLILWGTLAVLAVLTTILVATHRPGEKADAAPELSFPVMTLIISPRSVNEMLRVPGRIEPFRRAVLSSEQEGLIAELNADKGDAVTKGQVLLRIDGRAWEHARQRAAIEIEDAEKDVARWRELRDAGAVSINDHETMVIRKERAVIALKEAELFLSQCEVRSPLDGWVNDRHIEKGEYVAKGRAVFEVVDTSRLKAVFDVPEKEAPAARPGATAWVELAALPGERFECEVFFVSFVARRENNAFRVEAELKNPPPALKAGMIVNVELVRNLREDRIAVPMAAVLPSRGEHVVFVVENGRAVRRVVQIEAVVGSEAAIGAGLRAGDELIIDGHRSLRDGARVERAGI